MHICHILNFIASRDFQVPGDALQMIEHDRITIWLWMMGRISLYAFFFNRVSDADKGKHWVEPRPPWTHINKTLFPANYSKNSESVYAARHGVSNLNVHHNMAKFRRWFLRIFTEKSSNSTHSNRDHISDLLGVKVHATSDPLNSFVTINNRRSFLDGVPGPTSINLKAGNAYLYQSLASMTPHSKWPKPFAWRVPWI